MAGKNRENPASGANARHGRLRRSNSWANAARVLLTAVVVCAVSGVSVAAYAVWGLAQDIDTVDIGLPEAQAVGAGSQSLEGELNVLLVGSDARPEGSEMDDGEEGELNDVNLLLHVPADHKSATIISFPRDLMVPIPSCTDEDGDPTSAMSEQQINSALGVGGLGCVAATISELAGIEIPYAAMVDFDGVINISNAIGGVTVCLAQPLDDPMLDFHLPAGDVTVQGGEALQFLRSRYGIDNGSDTSRISNQQVFMSALLRQMRSAETLTNPVKVYSLAKAGVNSLTMSTSMGSMQFMQGLAGTAANIDLDRITFVQYPSYTHPDDPGRLVPDTSNGRLLMEVVLSGEPFELAGTGGGAVDPNAQETPAEVPLDENGDPIATEEPADGTGVLVLPSNITGQQASKETCSVGSS